MKKLLLFLVVIFSFTAARSQFVYKIKADSVLITNDSCTAELIIENSTKNVKGFLVNKGNGRTEFRRAQQLTDSSFIVAGDTIILRGAGTDSAMWKNDGVLTGNRVIKTGNSDLFFKLPTKTTESAPGLGHVYIGDSAYVAPWVVPHANQDGQTNAALIISKKKNNNDENPDMLAMTTSDAGTKNGWLFQNYTNSAGFVTPRLYTFSNVTSTGFTYGHSGYLHDAFAKSITSQSPVYTIIANDYDSANNGQFNKKVLHRTLYSFVNGLTPVLVIDSSENIGINTSSPKAKLHIAGTTDGVQQIIQLPITQTQANAISQIKNSNGDTLLDIRIGSGTSTAGIPYNSIYIGKYAGRNTTPSLLSNNSMNNTVVGDLAFKNATSSFAGTVMGFKAAGNVTTSPYMNIFGEQAADSITSGSNDVCVFGQQAMRNVLTSIEDVAVGNNALEDFGNGTSGGKTRQGNVSVGMYSGRNTNAVVTNNVFIGHSAGRGIATAGQTVTGNVLIGYQAGRNINNISNRLYIANSSTTTPLIYGEFDNNILATPGKFGIRIKTPEQALHVVGQVKIDTLTTGTGTDSLLVTNNGVLKKISQSGLGGSYTFSTGITNSSSTVTNNLSTGVSGGQSVIGGTDSGDTLRLSSTTNATKGNILFGNSVYDEVNNRLGIGTSNIWAELHVKRDPDAVALVEAGDDHSSYLRLIEGWGPELYLGGYMHYDGANNQLKIGTHNTENIDVGDDVAAIIIPRAGGRVGIGGVAPTATLHLAAGTTSSASLRIPAGSAPSSPNEGDIWQENDNLSFSTNSNTYTLAKTLTTTATLDFGSTAAGAKTDLTVTVTGATDGDVVSIGVPNGSTVANGSFTAWVSSSNTVTVRFTNNDLSTSYNPASGTFRVSVLKY